jgi:peptide/nickel transport system permease protein
VWTWLLKRTLLVFVTLFGIALISFLVVTLAPGDPAALKASAMGKGRSSGISEFTTRKNRELFFLDRPLVLNTSPATRTSTVAKTLAAANATLKIERKDARSKLTSDLGTAALDGLITALPALEAATTVEVGRRLADLDALKTASDAADATAISKLLPTLAERYPAYEPRLPHEEGKAPAPSRYAEIWLRQRKAMLNEAEAPTRRLVEILSSDDTWKDKVSGILPKARGGPDVGDGTPLRSAVQRWQAWWEEHQSAFTPDAVKTAADQWLKAGGDGERKALAYVGQLAAPILMDALEGASEGSPEEVRAAEGLVVVCKKPWALALSAEETSKFGVEFDDKTKRIQDDSERGPAAKQRMLEALGANTEEYVAAETAKELGRRRKAWATWWYRAEEYYVDFGSGAQVQRAFSQTQFGRWMSRFVRFDFGESYKHKRPVSELLIERLKVTLPLNLISLALIYVFALPIGIYSATRQNTFGDQASTVVLFVLYSIPSFWAGAMLIMLLTGDPFLTWFPAYQIESLDNEGFSIGQKLVDWAWHGFLPVVCLTYGGIAYLARQMRAGLLDVIRQDYIRTAKAKGLSEGVVIYKHALRNSMIPVLTLMAGLLPVLFGGSVIIEQIFTIEGLGKLAFDAVLDRDYPVIMANLVISGFLTLVGILLTDIAYTVVDPRIEFR